VMAVYVDNMRSQTGKWAGHMVADTREELEEMAKAIGLRPEWIQRPGTRLEHYDVTPAKRWAAIRAGAIPVTWRQMARIIARNEQEQHDERHVG